MTKQSKKRKALDGSTDNVKHGLFTLHLRSKLNYKQIFSYCIWVKKRVGGELGGIMKQLLAFRPWTVTAQTETRPNFLPSQKQSQTQGRTQQSTAIPLSLGRVKGKDLTGQDTREEELQGKGILETYTGFSSSLC